MINRLDLHSRCSEPSQSSTPSDTWKLLSWDITRYHHFPMEFFSSGLIPLLCNGGSCLHVTKTALWNVAVPLPHPLESLEPFPQEMQVVFFFTFSTLNHCRMQVNWYLKVLKPPDFLWTSTCHDRERENFLSYGFDFPWFPESNSYNLINEGKHWAIS